MMKVIHSVSSDRGMPVAKPQPQPSSFEPQFARAHKRALGVAVGLTAGVAIFVLTILHIVMEVDGLQIGLLNRTSMGIASAGAARLSGLPGDL